MPKPLTKHQYLVLRGWLVSTTSGTAGDPTREKIWLNIDDAFHVQAARDARDFRAAWVQFAAASRRAYPNHSDAAIAEDADRLLKLYHDRFSPDVEGVHTLPDKK